MINILLNGICGKMGQEVVKQASTNFQNKLQIVCGVDKNIATISDKSIYSDPHKITEEVDVIIDFSVPSATINILNYAKEKHLPVVIATTRFFKWRFKHNKWILKLYTNF